MENCIFCKIIKKDIQADIKYEDDHVLVFPDINPLKKVHLIVIPKEHIEDFSLVKNPELFSYIGKAIQKVIKQSDLSDKGYRVVVNGGGAQEVPHLHFHLMGPLGSHVKM